MIRILDLQVKPPLPFCARDSKDWSVGNKMVLEKRKECLNEIIEDHNVICQNYTSR